VDMSALSFTWDDSFPNYRVAQSGEELEVFKSPLHGKVLNAKQVAAAVKKYGEPKVDNPDMYRYIEAQMWDKPALTDFPHAVIHDVKPPAMHRAPVAKVSP